MKYLYKINEGFLDRFKIGKKTPYTFSSEKELKHTQPTKDDLYLIDPKVELVPNEKSPFTYYIFDRTETKSAYGYPTNTNNFKERLKNIKNINNWNSNGERKIGIQLNPSNRGGWLSNLGCHAVFTSGEVMFLQPHFDKLINISNKLGFKVGANVFSKIQDNSGKITEIKEVVAYALLGKYSTNTSGYKVFNDYEIGLTLFFKVNDKWSSIYDIELIKEEKKSNITDLDITDFFLELKDEGKLNVKYEMKSDMNGEYYDYSIIFVEELPSFFDELMVSYNRMKKVLKQSLVHIDFVKIDNKGLNFKVRNI